MAKTKKPVESKKIPIYLKYLNLKYIFFATIISLLSLILIFSVVIFFLNSRIYPGLSVAQTDLSLLSPPQAKQKLSATLSQRTQKTLSFNIVDSSNSSSPKKFDLDLKNSIDQDLDSSISQAWDYGHHRFYLRQVNLPPSIKFNSNYDSQIKSISISLNQPAINSQIKVEGNQITVTPSSDGQVLDEEALSQIIKNYLNSGSLSQTTLPLKPQKPKLSYETGLEIKKRLDSISLSPIKLTFQDQSYTLDLTQILSLLDLEDTESSIASLSTKDSKINILSVKVGNTETLDTKLKLNDQKVTEYLQKIAQNIDRPVQEPLLSVDPSSDPQKPKITQFQPPVEGQKLQIDKASLKLSQALLNQNQQVVELPVALVKPKNKLSNDLGINELVGRGQSNFAGSIPNRIFNVGLAAQRINGVLIPPGEEFSFTGNVGDISAATGYKQAYVIKSGRTVLDDGGGVCQVSTTIFRAALNAGLPITQRTAHAYRVGYYEQGYPPGLDATVFFPSVDFRFKNDTPSHILVQAYVSGTSLTVDLYGTSDGRVVNLTKPSILSSTPAPPEIRQDDPTLPKGTVKQVDFAAAGANVVFQRTVTRDGVTLITDTFRSNYRPWQAVYLVGTAE